VSEGSIRLPSKSAKEPRTSFQRVEIDEAWRPIRAAVTVEAAGWRKPPVLFLSDQASRQLESKLGKAHPENSPHPFGKSCTHGLLTRVTEHEPCTCTCTMYQITNPADCPLPTVDLEPRPRLSMTSTFNRCCSLSVHASHLFGAFFLVFYLLSAPTLVL
jgi:hypothetical protein